MNKRLSFIWIVGAAALGWTGCDGGEPCDDAASMVRDTCPEADVADLENGCGMMDGEACLSCVEAALADGADGCTDLLTEGGTCYTECVCDPASGRICGVDPGDAGMDDAGEDDEDAGPIDPCDITRTGQTIGSACSRNSCSPSSGLTCEMEQTGALPTVLPDESTMGPSINVTFNPNGGLCTTECLADGDCNDCSSCVGASGGDPGVCQSDCTPTDTDNGGCRDGWACSLNSGTCGLGCTSDDFCKLGGTVDTNGDGMIDAYVYDPDNPSTCNTTTGRCEFEGTAGAVAGDACTEDADCEDNGLCITGDAWPDGYCARIGCEFSGFECDGAGEACDLRNLGVSICMQGCDVGAESAADAIGADGNGDGCADGFMCSWTGGDGPDASPNGSCIPGNYNDVSTPNVGTACQTVDDCYSPHGYGRCLWGRDESESLAETGDIVGSGLCVIQNCARFMDGGEAVDGLLPGVTSEVRVCDFDAGERCVNFGSMDSPFNMCVTSCESADECAPGYACPELLGDGTRLCWPTCTEDGDCRGDATCQNVADDSACDADGPDDMPGTADDEECYCSDRMMRPPAEDGGVDSDAGTTADAGVSDAG